jgi:hypothetical protein
VLHEFYDLFEAWGPDTGNVDFCHIVFFAWTVLDKLGNFGGMLSDLKDFVITAF